MFIDSHCHLDFFDDAERREIIQRAVVSGVSKYVIPAVARENWLPVAKLAETSDCYATYGLHPLFLEKHQKDDIQALDDFLNTYPAVAIGECGLDYHVDTDKNQQQYYFEEQIALAQTHQLPLIIHARSALEQVLQTLKRYQNITFVVHSFSGSNQQLQKLLDLGGYVGIGGSVTYERAQRLRQQMAEIPSNRYLLETDAPDQPIAGYQGQKNEPARIRHIAEVVADLRGETLAQVACESTENTKRFFKIH